MVHQRHIHKHKKINRRTKENPFFVYRCILPACNNYYDSVGLMIGKEGICNRCEKVFIYKESHFQPRWPLRPHCDDCTRVRSSKKAEAKKTADKILEEKLGIKL